MQIKIEDKSSIKKVLSIEIPAEDITVELDKAYGELNKNANIKGFRKGKIPRKVLENRFENDVHADIVPKLIQNAYEEAIKQHKLNAVGNPKVDPPKLIPGNSYAFDISIEVPPELGDIEFEGIELKKVKYDVSDANIESQLHMIRKTMAKKESVKEPRPVKNTDFVLIDYEVFLDGVPYEKIPKLENYMLSIENNDMPVEFGEKLIGCIPVQDLDIEVTYGQEKDVADELKGKTIVFKVKLKEIREEVLPELNDDLAKELGKYESLEELKTAIRTQLENSIAQRVKHELAEQVFQHLIDKYNFEVPEAFIEVELNDIIYEAEQAYAANNIKLEDTGLSREILREQYKDTAEKQARRHIILNKIITQEKLELSDEELEKSFEKMALGMNIPIDSVKNFFNKSEFQLGNYKYTQLSDKAVNMIIGKGHVTEVEADDEHGDTDTRTNTD
jgi:trigger factor